MEYENLHLKYKQPTIKGRYLNLGMITPILNAMNTNNQLQILGNSVQGRPIYKYEIGHGATKILMWSQMHGNESTTTKGLLDFMNMLQDASEITTKILQQYTFCIVPMLNPDGAEVYTRVNANEVDLNRDFQNLSQAESQLLMQCYRDFKPNFCFNLHDQRTIFGVGTTGKPATVSFLAPSYDETKAYDAARLSAVDVIMKMVNVLQRFIPGQIGRFDDGFNINCVGDTFQALKTPTILIEAGHFPEDYEREITRKYIFIALISAVYSDSEEALLKDELSNYRSIPQNIPNFFDLIYKNVAINYDNSINMTNFAIQYREELINATIIFNAYITKIGELDGFYGHQEFDCEGMQYSDNNCNFPKLDDKADFSLNNKVKFVNGLVKK
ncbi:M14 family metallopeptidase [Flavobacterium sp. SM2513]|uniref:M14 family metallopeptidase n=1 Tax=Flavobacterium sp. SM2513 TaxID=3424766 RepID=UPI003D7FC022